MSSKTVSWIRCFCAWLAMVSGFGCQRDEGDSPEGIDYKSVAVSEQPLAGTISGAPWTFGWGVSKSLFSKDFTALSPGEAAEPCAQAQQTQTDSQIVFGFQSFEPGDQLFAAPTSPGGTATEPSIVFLPPDGDGLASSGKVILEEVTEATLTARMIARFDAANSVEGRFVVQRCSN